MMSLSRILRMTRRLGTVAVTDPKASAFQDVMKPDEPLDQPDAQHTCLGQRHTQLLSTLTKGHGVWLLFVNGEGKCRIKQHHCLWLSSCSPSTPRPPVKISQSRGPGILPRLALIQ